MDFMSDQLADRRRIRVLNVLDDCTRRCLASVVDTSISGLSVCRVLDQLVADHGTPEVLLVDNGPEFAGRALDEWAYHHGVRLEFIAPGKPTQNPLSFTPITLMTSGPKIGGRSITSPPAADRPMRMRTTLCLAAPHS